MEDESQRVWPDTADQRCAPRGELPEPGDAVPLVQRLARQHAVRVTNDQRVARLHARIWLAERRRAHRLRLARRRHRHGNRRLDHNVTTSCVPPSQALDRLRRGDTTHLSLPQSEVMVSYGRVLSL